ncbi:hypothetical protein RSAG8_07882, partial [Rhizoctonia solani AG-8 WAC10335]
MLRDSAYTLRKSQVEKKGQKGVRVSVPWRSEDLHS